MFLVASERALVSVFCISSVLWSMISWWPVWFPSLAGHKKGDGSQDSKPPGQLTHQLLPSCKQTWLAGKSPNEMEVSVAGNIIELNWGFSIHPFDDTAGYRLDSHNFPSIPLKPSYVININIHRWVSQFLSPALCDSIMAYCWHIMASWKKFQGSWWFAVAWSWPGFWAQTWCHIGRVELLD